MNCYHHKENSKFKHKLKYVNASCLVLKLVLVKHQMPKANRNSPNSKRDGKRQIRTGKSYSSQFFMKRTVGVALQQWPQSCLLQGHSCQGVLSNQSFFREICQEGTKFSCREYVGGKYKVL